jgi:hypothetical protein
LYELHMAWMLRYYKRGEEGTLRIRQSTLMKLWTEDAEEEEEEEEAGGRRQI